MTRNKKRWPWGKKGGKRVHWAVVNQRDMIGWRGLQNRVHKKVRRSGGSDSAHNTVNLPIRRLETRRGNPPLAFLAPGIPAFVPACPLPLPVI